MEGYTDGGTPLSDEAFDELGRSAGEALRLPAPSGGAAAIGRRARRRAISHGVGVAGAVAAVAVAGIALTQQGNDDRSPTTVAPAPVTSPASTVAPTTVPPPTTETTPVEPPVPSAPPTTAPAPVAIDADTAAAIATNALLDPGQIGAGWGISAAYADVSPLSADGVGAECADFVGNVLDPTDAAVAWTGFAPEGVDGVTTYQYVAVHPTVDAASAMMDAIARPEFVACLQERFSTLGAQVGEAHVTGGVGVFQSYGQGDREITFNAVYDDAEPLNQVHSFIQVERAILYLNPTRRLGADVVRIARPAVTELRRALGAVAPGQAALAAAADRAHDAVITPAELGDGWVDAYTSGLMYLFDGGVAGRFSLGVEAPAAGDERPPGFDEACVGWGDPGVNPLARSIALDDGLLASTDGAAWVATVVWELPSEAEATDALTYLADGPGNECYFARGLSLLSAPDGAPVTMSWPERLAEHTLVERTDAELTYEQTVPGTASAPSSRMVASWHVSGSSVVHVVVRTPADDDRTADTVLDAARRAADDVFDRSAPGTSSTSEHTNIRAGFAVGERHDVAPADEPWTDELWTDGTVFTRRCSNGDEVRCQIILRDAVTLQQIDDVVCPNGSRNDDPYVDPAAMPAFLRRYPAGDTSTGDSSNWGWTVCGVDITDSIVLAGRSAFDAITGDELWSVSPEVNAAVLSSDGTTVVVRESNDYSRFVLDARTGEVLRELPRGLFVSPDPTGRFSFDPNGGVVELATGRIVFARGWRGAFFDRRGAQFVMLVDDRLELVDTATWTTRWRVPSASVFDDESNAELGLGDVSGDGTLLAIGLEPRIVDTSNGAILGVAPDVCDGGTVDEYRWMPDEPTLVVRCSDAGGSSWIRAVSVGLA